MYSLDDCRWLVGPEASPHLAQALKTSGSREQILKTLRRRLPSRQCELVLEQAELRRRATHKFQAADRMFFSRTLLEQASDERIAQYKAKRFPGSVPVFDLCCGLGGDSLELATRGPVHAVDRCPIATLLTTANSQALGRALTAQTADVRDVLPQLTGTWHLDPDRRPTGQRTTTIEAFEPAGDVIERLLSSAPQGALKLAPATLVPSEWAQAAELEWIGSRRECRQQVVWFGELGKNPGLRRATVVDSDGTHASWSGSPETQPAPTATVGRYLHEPHAAVLAAHLEYAIASQNAMTPIATNVAYFTSDLPAATPLISSFEVLEELSMDERKLRAALRERQVGQLEIKVRGADISPDVLRRSLRLNGEEARTLMIAGPIRQLRAFLTRRVS